MYNFSSRILKKHHLKALLSVAISILMSLSLTACGETKDAETLISEAVEYQKKGNDNAAIIQLKNALQQEPNNKEARFQLGVLLQKSGDLLAAEKELDRALNLGLDADTVIPVLTQVLFDLGKFQMLLDTVDRYPDMASVEVKILQGRALLAVGRREESKVMLDQLLAENPDSAEVLIGLAQHALSEKDLDLANRFSNQAVEKNPENPTAWFFRAQLLQAQGNAAEALAAFERVIQLAPDNLSAHISKATIEIGIRKFDNAKNTIARARQVTPENIGLNHTQALLDYTQGRHAEALTSIQAVLSVAPEYLPSVLLAGAIQLSLGSLPQAEQYLEQYLKKNPADVYARKLMINTLLQSNQSKQALTILEPTLAGVQNDPQLFALAGEVYMRSGDFIKATEFYEKANELVPNNATIHTALGLSKLATGDSAHGIAELELALDLDRNSPRAGILLTLAHLRANAFDKALATVDELIKADPQNPLFYNLKGAIFLSKNDVTKARENFNQALAIQPDFFPAVSNLARLDMQDQKPDVAKGRFEAILKNDNKNIQVMSALSGLAFAQGNTAEATRWLELASDRNPNELEPALLLTAHYLRIDDKEKASLLARKLNGTYPNEPRVLEILGRVQLAQNNPAAALDSFERLAGRLPESAPAQLQIANVHSMMKDYAAASAALRKALFINPDFVDAKVALVRLAILEGKADQAMSLTQNIQKDHATIPHGYELEGDLWMSQNKPEMAAKVYEKAFSMAQNNILVMKIHTALSQAGNDEKALTEIIQWLAKNPEDTPTRLYLANAYLGKKQYANATKEYEIIVQKNPQHLMSLNNLAWLYQQNKDSRALEYAEKAYELSPQNPAIQDTFAWILIEKGEIDRALPMLEKAASQLPDNATVQYHYAHALVKSGNPAQARQILNKITAGDVNFSEIEAARELLKQVQ